MASVIISIRVNFSDIVKHISTFDTLMTSIHPNMNSIWYTWTYDTGNSLTKERITREVNKVLDSVKHYLYEETYFDENSNIIDKVCYQV